MPAADLRDLDRDSPEFYFEFSREEMLEFLPEHPLRILDVGCGSGLFGKTVKERTGAEVWGIEMNENAAVQASARIDKVFICPVEEALPQIPEHHFDCICFNDILEHLYNPYQLLLQAKKYLKPDGVISASIPNIRYHDALFDLVFRKQWTYMQGGTLDKTHIRFFTEKSIREMWRVLDFEILKMKGVSHARERWPRLLNMLTLGWLSDTLIAQFGCCVRPRRG